jgi:hypothetical protein
VFKRVLANELTEIRKSFGRELIENEFDWLKNRASLNQQFAINWLVISSLYLILQFGQKD